MSKDIGDRFDVVGENRSYRLKKMSDLDLKARLKVVLVYANRSQVLSARPGEVAVLQKNLVQVADASGLSGPPKIGSAVSF